MYWWPCPTPGQASCLLHLLEILKLPLCQQDDRASNSLVSSSAPTDTADGYRVGALEAHQKQKKSSLGTNQNITPTHTSAFGPKCLFDDLPWTGANFSPFWLSVLGTASNVRNWNWPRFKYELNRCRAFLQEFSVPLFFSRNRKENPTTCHAALMKKTRYVWEAQFL